MSFKAIQCCQRHGCIIRPSPRRLMMCPVADHICTQESVPLFEFIRYTECVADGETQYCIFYFTHVSIVQPYRNCMSCIRDMSVSSIATIPHSHRDNTRNTSTHTVPCTALPDRLPLPLAASASYLNPRYGHSPTLRALWPLS